LLTLHTGNKGVGRLKTRQDLKNNQTSKFKSEKSAEGTLICQLSLVS
jgi:hypothetical protein